MSPKLVQWLAQEIMVAVEPGRLAARSHHPLAHVTFLDSVGVVHCLPRRPPLFFRQFLSLFILIHISFQHVDVAFDGALLLVRFKVEHILILRRCGKWGNRQQ